MGWTMDNMDEFNESVLKDYKKLGANYIFLISEEEKQQLIAKKVGKQVYHNEKLYVFKIY
jgi:hypothetical protein